MKNTLIICLVVFGFIACQQGAEPEGPSNTDIIQSAYDAFANGDVEAVLSKMDSTITWNEAESFIYADGNPYVGPGSVVEGVFARLGMEWEYWRLEDISLKPLGENGVLAQGRYVAKKKDTGAELNAQFAHVWTLKDGMAVAFQQYTDTKQAYDVYNAPPAESEDGEENDQGS